MTMRSNAVTRASLSPTSLSIISIPSSPFACPLQPYLQEVDAKIAAKQAVVAGPLKDKFGKLARAVCSPQLV